MAAQPRALLLLPACFFLFFIVIMSRHFAAAVSFSYDFSKQGVLDSAGLDYSGDAVSSDAGDRILLTEVSSWRIGLVAYPQPVRLWDHRTGKAASFSTSFSFAMNSNSTTRGGGMVFFVRPFPAREPANNSTGPVFGLFSYPGEPGSSPPAVGVEFDTFWNKGLDPPDISGRDHIGIDVNQIHSVNYTKDLTNGDLSGTMSADVTYDAASKLLVVILRLANGSTHAVQAQPVDFKDAGLPPDAAVGFSATTGGEDKSNELLSWSFSSTDAVTLADPSCKTKPLVLLLGAAYGVGACILAAILYIGIGLIRRRLSSTTENENPVATERHELLEMTNNNLSNDTTEPISLPVPTELTYQEVSAATDNFSIDRKLGKGSFGEVYRGDLPCQLKVAVKKLILQLPQTRRDYANEIKILGKLYHRNLVKLVGWCDGSYPSDTLLLVYELMVNRSVDMYLHGSERLLTWLERHKIVLGVGSAIEYLHTGCPKTILHRDIKPSNVMLDDDFVAKLGDFGLVREMDPGLGSLGGTLMIGDRAYLDPVCDSKNTVSLESDVYSFGVMLLEIATGKRPVVVQGTGGRLSNTLVDAVRASYDKGELLGMADEGLNGDFDKGQMERVLLVGLLCVQQQREHRPKIRTVVNLLSDLSYTVPQILPSQ